ncbi:ankyrin repeat domain-containing protein [Bacillus cereus]|uniref:ankyrin repeat domain-containing protein n=1 Tax=Bacillus cereus TaxID=1396 RepID=UPI0024BDF8DF|nr:ankyrin repeat domain-containing protein [Bacillus cereus]
MEEKSINKTIRNAIKLGDINEVKRVIGDNPEFLHLMTPFGAIYDGHKEVVEFLVEKGIDISIRYTGENIKNMNAYEYAEEFGQTEIATYIKRKMDKR